VSKPNLRGTRYCFSAPRSVKAARERRLQLVAELNHIQSQLADRNRIDENGVRMVGDAYHAWRSKAISAQSIKQAECAYLKAWLIENTREVGQKSKYALLVQALALFDKLAEEDVDFDDTETALVEDIRAVVNNARK